MDELKPLEMEAIRHGVEAVKVDPDAKYLIFINLDIMNHELAEIFLCDPHNSLPAGTPVYLIPGDIARAIRIYKLFDDPKPVTNVKP